MAQKTINEALKAELIQISKSYLATLEKGFYSFNCKTNYYNQNSIKGSTVRAFTYGGVTTESGTYVEDWGGDLRITLSIEDTVNYALTNNISVTAAAKYLMSHEVFHVLLGHFGEKYKNHDQKLLNIAGDLEINSYLGIEHPAIVPEDFNLPRYLSTDMYYEKLLALQQANQLKRNSQSNQSNNGSSASSDSTENNSTEQGEQTDTDAAQTNQTKESQTDSNNTNSNNKETTPDQKNSSASNGRNAGKHTHETKEEHEARLRKEIQDNLGVKLPENTIINQTSSEKLDAIGQTIEPVEDPANYNLNEMNELIKLAKDSLKVNKTLYDKYNLNGLDEIMRKLVRSERDQKIVPHTKKSTYYKLNNRRTSDFILPGKKLLEGGVAKKFATTLTVFIDVSGSTRGPINRDLMAVAYRLHKENATIVYYTSDIELIIEPSDPFLAHEGFGGTNIVMTIKEYLKNHKLERAYIFTDGEDDFKHLGKVTDKYSVFFVRNGMVYERYNNKKPQEIK